MRESISEKHAVHNLIILDESGSMSDIKRFIISGFNELVQSIKSIQKQFPEQEHYITMISFNSTGNKILHFIDPVDKLQVIDDSRYNPDAMTPLYDAIGFGVNKLRQVLQDKIEYNVMVTILTDGEENASVEYNAKHVKALIEELTSKDWKFTYLGTDHDVEKVAATLSIKHSRVFEKSKESISQLFEEDTQSRMMYSADIDRKRKAKKDKI